MLKITAYTRTKTLSLAGIACAIVGLGTNPALATEAIATIPVATQDNTQLLQGDLLGAIRQWQVLAERGNSDAQFNLGQAYKYGHGVPIDLAKAEELFQRAAQMGHQKAADCYGLLLFQRGEHKQAIPFIEAAAQRGDARAQYILALVLFNGEFIPKNWDRAYALINLAEEGGLPQASDAKLKMEEFIPPQDRRKNTQLAVVLSDQTRGGRRIIPASSSSRNPNQESVALTRQALSKHRDTSLQDHELSASAIASPWHLRLGSFRIAANADKLLGQLQAHPALSGYDLSLSSSERFTVVQATGSISHQEAKSACEKLNATGFACLASRY